MIHIENLKKHNILLIIVFLLILIIIPITTKVYLQQNLIIDSIAYKILVEKTRNPILNEIMKALTTLSNTEGIIVVAIFLFFIIKNKKVAMTIPVNLAFVAVLNRILKLIFIRPRPSGFRLIEIGGYSFPSGHAMASTAFYGLLIYLSYKLIKNQTCKKVLISLNVLIILMVGISRVYLGVHYLSDVLVGQAISIIYLFAYTKVLEKINIIE